jgi:hypothetical protein
LWGLRGGGTISFLDDDAAVPETQFNASGLTEPAESLEVTSSPIGILGVALVSLVVGVVALLFWATAGAVIGYVATLVTFVLVLVFRRHDSVLRQTSIVTSLASVDRGVTVLTVATLLVMAASVWVVATEVSRTV